MVGRRREALLMFPLFTKVMPASATELERALNATIDRLFTGVTQPVTVRDKAYPQLTEIRIVLDRAQLRANPQGPPRVTGPGAPALTVERMEIEANALTIGPATGRLRLQARDVQLHQGEDATGERVLLLHRASEGEIELGAEKAAIEAAIASVAKQEAGKHGVEIDQVRLTLQSRGDRSLTAEVQLRARKLFFSTIVRIGAQLDVDEKLEARLSGLSCHGDGAIGAIACGTLQPHLAKLDGRSFSLLALPLGEVKLRDVRIAAGDEITIHAEFAS